MGVNQKRKRPGRDGPGLAIAFEVLTRRLLRLRTRYGRKPERKRP